MNVLIVGASTRAAAFSALRAGLRPRCLDLFADADLAARCPVARLDPDGPFDPPACDAWLYTGSMEARPDLVELQVFTTARHTKLWNYDQQRWTDAIGDWLRRHDLAPSEELAP